MKFNGNQQWLEHLINLKRQPEKQNQLQTEANQKRLARVEKALTTRPFFLPLQFTLPASAQVSPVVRKTDSLNHDVIVLGAIANNAGRRIQFRRADNLETNFAFLDDTSVSYLTVEEISGQSGQPSGGGQRGVYFFTAPIDLPAGKRLQVEMFKPEATVEPETVWAVFICLRVFTAPQYLDPLQKELVTHFMNVRKSPEPRFVKYPVDFDASGLARNVRTPVNIDEPLLLRGCKTTLKHSLVEVNIEGEPLWSLNPFPIWALAEGLDAIHQNYQFLERSVLLPARTQLVMKLTNTLGDGYADADGDLTWTAETV